jgi:hypothetical protein
VVSAGTNDVAMNYFILPVRADSFPTIDQYSDYLIGRLQGYLQVRTLSFAHTGRCSSLNRSSY